MKKLFPVLVTLLLIIVMFSGCIPGLELPVSEDPDPGSELIAANVEAVLVVGDEGKASRVVWSIENIGKRFIREYIVTFKVIYPMNLKDILTLEVTGNYLEVGEKIEGILYLVEYDTPETVFVEWELFE